MYFRTLDNQKLASGARLSGEGSLPYEVCYVRTLDYKKSARVSCDLATNQDSQTLPGFSTNSRKVGGVKLFAPGLFRKTSSDLLLGISITTSRSPSKEIGSLQYYKQPTLNDIVDSLGRK